MNNKIALLATGDEITQGSILNTNAQQIAHTLFSHGMEMGWHISVDDDEKAIEEAIGFLLEKHAVVITIGGLGPTSDDKTRFALANYLNEPLEIHQASFDSLQERYKAFNMPFGELAQQQAKFPKNADILENTVGSANGCVYTKISLKSQFSPHLPYGHLLPKGEKQKQEVSSLYQNANKAIFMLPGPPHECLPMFQNHVLPRLVEQYASGKILFQWKVFGVPEGIIAEKVDTLVKSYPCRTSFRWNYPYVDCKVLLDEHLSQKEEIITKLDELLQPYQLDPSFHDHFHPQSATERLKKYLTQIKTPLFIQDHATGGVLESRLRTQQSHPMVFFTTPDSPDADFFRIEGLENYWKGTEDTHTELTLTTRKQTQAFQLPCRKTRLEEYAAEFIAHQMHAHISR